MKKLAATMAITATAALTALIATEPANAAFRRHHHGYHGRAAGPGYYEGQYEYQVDRNDRASSPYSGF